LMSRPDIQNFWNSHPELRAIFTSRRAGTLPCE
jgi:hypothetical protein